MGDSCRNHRKRNARVAGIEASSTSFSDKRTKAVPDGSLDSELRSHPSLPGLQDKLALPASRMTSGGSVAKDAARSEQSSSFRSSNDSCEIVKDSLELVDLEAPSFETEIRMYVSSKFSRETTPTSGNHRDSVMMDTAAKHSPAAAKDHQKKQPALKMPTQAEIDEFFSAAEKYEQKRFAEKYNYDIAKDVPLEGRFEWVPLKPSTEKR